MSFLFLLQFLFLSLRPVLPTDDRECNTASNVSVARHTSPIRFKSSRDQLSHIVLNFMKLLLY